MNDKFVLFDGNNLSHIAFHRGKSIILKNKKDQEPDEEKRKEIVLTPEDFPAVEGMYFLVYFRKLHKYIKKFTNSHYIMTWDNPGSSEWRKAIYPEYKSNRVYDVDPIWQVLFNGIEKLTECLNYYPFYQVKIEKLEADDILYAYSKELSQIGKVTIVSGDSDMIQVAQEFEVKLFHPIKDKYVEIPKDYDYCLYKAIKGDTADVIEGVYGYGEVKSERLAREAYKTGKLALNEDQKKIVSENLKIISIANNPNLNNAKVEIDKIKDARNNLDFQKIKKFYFDHKVRSLLETFDSVMSIFE